MDSFIILLTDFFSFCVTIPPLLALANRPFHKVAILPACLPHTSLSEPVFPLYLTSCFPRFSAICPVQSTVFIIHCVYIHSLYC